MILQRKRLASAREVAATPEAVRRRSNDSRHAPVREMAKMPQSRL